MLKLCCIAEHTWKIVNNLWWLCCKMHDKKCSKNKNSCKFIKFYYIRIDYFLRSTARWIVYYKLFNPYKSTITLLVEHDSLRYIGTFRDISVFLKQYIFFLPETKICAGSSVTNVACKYSIGYSAEIISNQLPLVIFL